MEQELMRIPAAFLLSSFEAGPLRGDLFGRIRGGKGGQATAGVANHFRFSLAHGHSRLEQGSLPSWTM
jgi:hypothetical protein